MDFLSKSIIIFSLTVTGCSGLLPQHALNQSELFVERGNKYLSLSEIYLARESYKLALQYNSENHRAWLGLGTLHSYDDADKALIFYRKVISLKHDNVEALTNMGAIYLRKGMIKKARKFTLYALTFNPGKFEANYNMCLIEIISKNWKSALTFSRKIYVIRKTHQTKELLDYTLLMAGEIKNKTPDLMEPSSVFGYLIFHQYLKGIGREEEAEKIIEFAKKKFGKTMIMKSGIFR
ncbi:MAG: hypothetical protein JXR95_15945 [Deltaproteobacteria bacterium]|nr:hypothetical protein [Deltaproteobacteria bacterium]